MDKKSQWAWLEESSENTRKNYNTSIRHYEEFHQMSIDVLIQEALDEQTERIPEHLLKVYDRIMDFQHHLMKEYKYGSIKEHCQRIRTVYKRARVKLPYLPPLDPKKCMRSEPITYDQILTKEEIKQAISLLSPNLQARAMIMATGGYSLKETSILTLNGFLNDLYEYHKSDDVYTALKRIAEQDNIIWVTQLIRVKTQKPYYGVCNPETVQAIARSWLTMDIEREKKKYAWKHRILEDEKVNLPLFKHNSSYISQKFGEVNDKLKLGKAGGKRRFTPHSLRRFNATRLSGASLTDEESLKVSMIDEIQGRSMNNVQDRYIKTNPIRQKLLYAKVMNNVSLYNRYEHELVDGEVVVRRVNQIKKNEKLEKENKKLQNQIKKSNEADLELKEFIETVGKDNFKKQLTKLLGEL